MLMKMKKLTLNKILQGFGGCGKGKVIFFSLLSVFSISLACQSNSSSSRFEKNPTNSAIEKENRTEVKTEETPKLNEFEEDLRAVQIANFEYTFVFRRKDGKPFDGESNKYLKANSPIETNQWYLTDGKMAVIAGSNYPFSPENLKALENRFKIEDYSRKKEESSTKKAQE